MAAAPVVDNRDAATGAPLLRTSERSDYKRCAWLWYQTWVLGWRSKREPTWAWFGTAIHRGLEERYKPGGKKRGTLDAMEAAFEAALDKEERRMYTEGLETDTTDIVDGRTLGLAMLRGYVDEYGKDSHWRVLHTEQPFQINVPDPKDPEKVLVVYAGTWDLAVYDLVDKVYRIVDHKTRRSFPTNWSFYSINDQAGSYLWVAREVLLHKGILKTSDTIDGLVFNALRKHLPDDRPVNENGERLNKNGSVSLRQPAPLFHREEVWRSPQERVTQARRVQNEAVIMDKVRRGKLPLIKTPTEDCVRCPLFEYCELDEQNPEEAQEFAKATLKKRDPYADHREDMTERGGIAI